MFSCPENLKVVALVNMAAPATPRRQIFVCPASEIRTVLDRRPVSNDRAKRWRSETCLDEKFFENDERYPRTGYVCGSYELTNEQMDESEGEMATKEEPNIPAEVKRSALKINLKPTCAQGKPRLVKAQSMASLPKKERSDNGLPQSNDRDMSKFNRRKNSIDVSLAKLRVEMVSTEWPCFR